MAANRNISPEDQARLDKMNAPKVYNGGDKCSACWGRGWTTHFAFTCQNCKGTGKAGAQ